MVNDIELRSVNKTPHVSVLLPVYNGEKTIRLAVKSILDQSYTDFELILLDDGSTDQTLSILRAIHEPRVRIISDGKNKGLAARLNEGVSLAKGTYIARMDADDLAFPERLKKQVAYLDEHPEIDLLGARALVFADNGPLIGLLPYRATHEELTSQSWRNIPLPHPTWMGRKEWFKKYPYRSPEVMRSEDQEVLLRAAPDSTYACLPDILLAYRQFPFNLRKTLSARKHLLFAQIGIFWRRKQYANMLRAVGTMVAKLCIDLCAALPGAQNLFFFRMRTKDIPADALNMLVALSKEEESPSRS